MFSKVFKGEPHSKNPWVFNLDRTFMTMRDKHHGTWKTEGNNMLKMVWKSVNGYADFSVI